MAAVRNMDQRVQRTKPRGKRHIQSIAVGFRLLRALEEAGRPVPLKTVAALAGMPASKAHLYMTSFVQVGLVAQDMQTMHYGLGAYAVQLGLAALRQVDVVDAGRDVLDDLQRATGLSVFLSVLGNRGPVIVAKCDGAVQAPMSIRVGYVLPLHASATGRVLLAHLAPGAAERMAPPNDEDCKGLRARAEASLPQIRATGVATSDSQVNAGFAAVSGPIFDHAGEIAAAITAIGMRDEVDLSQAGPVARLIREAAAKVSRRIGHSGIGPVPQAVSAQLDGPPAVRAQSQTR